MQPLSERSIICCNCNVIIMLYANQDMFMSIDKQQRTGISFVVNNRHTAMYSQFTITGGRLSNVMFVAFFFVFLFAFE